MALPWIAPSPTTSYCIKGPSSTRSFSPCATRGPGAPSYCSIWASLLFDELATKLQLRDKVASRQRDYSLYWDSAPFTVGKTRAAPHRLAPARSAQLWQAAMPMPLSFSRQQPFLATRGRGSGLPFHQRRGRRHRSGLPVSQTRALVSPIVTRPSTLDPLDIPRQVVVLPPFLTRKMGSLSLFRDVWRRRRCSEWVCNVLEVGFRLRFRECPPMTGAPSAFVD